MKWLWIYVDRFMHCVVCDLLATTEQRERKVTGKQKYFLLGKVTVHSSLLGV
jgi:hypothetical protein